jgi:hypothetical protein
MAMVSPLQVQVRGPLLTAVATLHRSFEMPLESPVIQVRIPLEHHVNAFVLIELRLL